MSDAESVLFFRKNLFHFNLQHFRPLGNPNKFIQAILQHFSRLADENITPPKYLDWAKNQKSEELELANAYDKYQKLKIKTGNFDFGDLIFYLIKLFGERPALLSDYKKRFRYVLVDEFQDTNIAQYDLIKLLCPPHDNPHLTMVGDDSQAIYKFRGASVSNILTFQKDYPKSKLITLIKNYRSNQSILDHAYRLIKFNNPDTLEYKLGISKKLIAVSDKKQIKGNKVEFNLFDKVQDEAEFIADRVIRLNKQYKYSDFAILLRANKQAQAFIRTFRQKGAF